MEEVLDPVSSTGQALYAEPYDPQRPVVCFDETSTQLLAETRPALPAQAGLPRRQDYEYRREGTRNLFLACEPLAGWRQVAVTQRRTMQDFAQQMRWLVDEAYPEVPVVRVVLDNPVSSTGQALNTHRLASLYETFPAQEARRIAKRLEFHYTPKHGSWLNPVLSLPKGWRKSSSAYWPAPASASGSPTRMLSGGKSGPRCSSGTGRGSSPTGVSVPKMPGQNSIASIPLIPNMTDYYVLQNIVALFFGYLPEHPRAQNALDGICIEP